MQEMSIKNVLIQAMKPTRFFVMLKKIFVRMIDAKGSVTNKQNLKWMESNVTDFEKLAVSLDVKLWEEAVLVSGAIEKHAIEVLENIEYDLGGGGCYPFLYFITRYMEPDCIVETGVAAGFSSYSFLAGIKDNKRGKLYSSDFPYFRIPNPEKYIGVVVDEKLKDNWNLYIDGDEVNLKIITKNLNKVDLFHYDSDKSYSGRNFAVSIIKPLLSNKGILLMDDIQDNPFFYDYVKDNKPDFWRIFKFQGKYVGLIGKITGNRDK